MYFYNVFFNSQIWNSAFLYRLGLTKRLLRPNLQARAVAYYAMANKSPRLHVFTSTFGTAPV